jgi:hypothetical protein
MDIHVLPSRLAWHVGPSLPRDSLFASEFGLLLLELFAGTA